MYNFMVKKVNFLKTKMVIFQKAKQLLIILF